MIICLSLSSIPKLRTPKMLIFSIRDMFANVSFLNTRGLEPRPTKTAVTPEQGERGRLRVGRLQVGAKALGWNSSSHTGFLPAVRARAEVGARPGLPAVDTKRTPKDPATPYTHRFPPRPPRGSRGSLRPACIYAAGQGHAGKSEARGACAALASGTR